ncbi:hypothetical protein KAH55_11515 [bacterium]|nr:hypothetical protein [bacterium]
MDRKLVRACLVWVVALLMACAESGTSIGADTTGTPKMTIQRQVPGCQGNGLGKNSADQCFKYTWLGDKLKLEFCVIGNCCPDTDRFLLDSEFNGTDLFVAVADPAARRCKCMCNYKVQAEFSDVTGSIYTVFCTYDDSVLYHEHVVRLY